MGHFVDWPGDLAWYGSAGREITGREAAEIRKEGA